MIRWENKCPKCGLPYIDEGKTTGKPELCKCVPDTPVEKALMGWICPRCQTVHSPFVNQCYCPPPTYSATSAGSANRADGFKPIDLSPWPDRLKPDPEDKIYTLQVNELKFWTNGLDGLKQLKDIYGISTQNFEP